MGGAVPRDSEKMGESVPYLGSRPAPGQPCTFPDLGILDFWQPGLSLAPAQSEADDGVLDLGRAHVVRSGQV